MLIQYNTSIWWKIAQVAKPFIVNQFKCGYKFLNIYRKRQKLVWIETICSRIPLTENDLMIQMLKIKPAQSANGTK